MCVEVTIEDDRWKSAGIDALAQRAVSGVQDYLGPGGGWRGALLGCDCLLYTSDAADEGLGVSPGGLRNIIINSAPVLNFQKLSLP